MLWANIASAIQVALLGWFVLVLGLLLWNAASGRMLLSGMLHKGGGTSLELHRLQLLGITLCFAIFYVALALGRDPALGLPNISTPLLIALTGSQAVYLGGKYLN